MLILWHYQLGNLTSRLHHSSIQGTIRTFLYQVLLLILQAKFSSYFNNNIRQQHREHILYKYIQRRRTYLQESQILDLNSNPLFLAILSLLESIDLLSNITASSSSTTLHEFTGNSTQTDQQNNHLFHEANLNGSVNLELDNEGNINTNDNNYENNARVDGLLFDLPPYQSPSPINPEISPISCKYCKKAHLIENCPKLANKQCYRCDQFGHLARCCTNPLAN